MSIYSRQRVANILVVKERLDDEIYRTLRLYKGVNLRGSIVDYYLNGDTLDIQTEHWCCGSVDRERHTFPVSLLNSTDAEIIKFAAEGDKKEKLARRIKEAADKNATKNLRKKEFLRLKAEFES